MEEVNIYNKENPVFQVDSEIVKKTYKECDNYLIEYDDRYKETNICVIYFSGHSIYYPNDIECFKRTIIENNRFEWFGIRFQRAYKHIFIRDIHKQWYLAGINSEICNPKLLLEFLQKETDGYQLITIGSSAGGYASLLYGNLLGAIRIYAFSPQVELHSLQILSSEQVDPLAYRLQNTWLNKYYDIIPYIKNGNSQTLCFMPSKYKWDKIQYEYLMKHSIERRDNITLIRFNTSKHGVPFPKVALNVLLKEDAYFKLLKYRWQTLNPIIFSISQVGLIKTLKGIIKQLYRHYYRM